MNPAQIKTVKGCGIAVVALFLVGVYMLYVELVGAAAGDQNATISRLLWGLWASQPWVIFLLSHLVAGPVWFLAGHFVAQSSNVYDAIRKGGRN